MTEIKSDLYKVYVYGRPKGSGNKPLIKVCKCGKNGKIQREIGKYDLSDTERMGFDIVSSSHQALDYFLSRLDE